MQRVILITFAVACTAISGCWKDQQIFLGSGDTDSETDPIQDSVLFGLRNATNMSKYLEWDTFGAEVVGCKPEDGTWGDCSWELPWCAIDCASVNAGDNCDMECDTGMAVLEIPPGETYYWTWQKKIYEPDEEHCSAGTCFRAVEPAEDIYRMHWVVYRDFECYGTDCEPDDDWVINNAWVEGYSIEIVINFNPALLESELVTTISEP